MIKSKIKFKNSKINPTDFHTIWPEISKNYGSLFFKISKLFSKITKTPKISENIFKLLKTSKISQNYDKIEFQKIIFKNKSARFSYKMAQNSSKLRIFIFQNSKNF